MGMDVFGKKPDSEEGKYFRASVWSWHPLADYTASVAPAGTWDRIEYPHSNDGDGLDGELSKTLAGVLQQAIDSGDAARYLADRQTELAAMPDEECRLCGGTGTRTDDLVQTIRGTDSMPCNACDATGKVRPNATHYGFDLEHLQEWATFLAHCGGFEVW